MHSICGFGKLELATAALLVVLNGCDGFTLGERAPMPASARPERNVHIDAPVNIGPRKVVRPRCQPNCPQCPYGQPCRAAAPQSARELAEFTAAALPYCDVPAAFRVRNYAGGSCVHASIETVMHWQGLHELAVWWRKTYAQGEYAERMHDRLEGAGLRFACVQNRGASGLEFLRKCCALRLCCAVNLPEGHMQTLVGMDASYFYVIDNNGAGEVDAWPREQFLRAWTGWAVTVVYDAPPPEPFL